MIYAKFWTKVHRVPQQGADSQLRDIKFSEDLSVIRHFDGLYRDFQRSAGDPAGTPHEAPGRDSDSGEEEPTDIMEVLNKELEKINAESSAAPKGRKTNPYAYAQKEFKKSRVISKRLNTLSIFVKKDLETKYHDNLFDEDEKEQPQPVAKKSKK